MLKHKMFENPTPHSAAGTPLLQQISASGWQDRVTHLCSDFGSLSVEESVDLMQQLQLHQIELELQNAELRCAQAELDTAQARYFDFFDMAPVGYCSVSEKQVIKQANLTTTALLRTTRQALLGQAFTRFITPVDQDLFYLFRRKLLDSRKPLSCELQLVRFDCTRVWTNLNGIAVPDDDGSTTLRLVLSDITDRKQLEESTRIAATAFENQQGMSITDAKGCILRVNKAFTKITGYSAEEVIGKELRLLQPERQDAAFYQARWDSIVHDGFWQGEICNRRKNGEIYPEWLTISAVKDDAGAVTHFVGAFSDISERKVAEQRIQTLAFYDTLTGLPNRALLRDRLQHALTAGARLQGQAALLHIDLDDFKTINDTLGHDQGDQIIKEVAKRLGTCARISDTLARIGGDEFILLLEGPMQDHQDPANLARVIGDKVLAALSQPFEVDGSTHHSSASIGITLVGRAEHDSVDEPLKQAELAMYQAKAAGRATLRFFDPEMQATVKARASLESRLREALAQQQFVLHYQPQVDHSGQVIGSEALVRWLDPKRGMVSPVEFIPAAEQSGLILPLGQWVLETACNDLVRWAGDPVMAHLPVAVNVSARQFRQSTFVDKVVDTLKRTGANPKRLKLELTESMLVEDVEGVIAKMSALKAFGVSFSLDDFGTGYSSLSCLKRLPLYQLKIDQGFVRDIEIDINDAAIARTVIALAQSMGLGVIAEGVETEGQRDFLASLGCHSYQGYLFSKPLPRYAYEAFSRRV
jgi:diguanylate cyclase (GGDEF)-like protein/PAS domain S-box-containing protein